MKNINAVVLLIFTTFVCVSGSTDDNNCVWSYKCCAFKEINGEVNCVQMCEPEINCQEVKDEVGEVEVFEENTEANSRFSIRTACKRGFLFNNGRCRRVL